MDWRKQIRCRTQKRESRLQGKGRTAIRSPQRKPGSDTKGRTNQANLTEGNSDEGDDAFSEASLSEEPGAGKLHAGICAGGVRQLAGLPRWRFHRG